MRVLITGADGFIGKNLVIRLREISAFEILTISRTDSEDKLCQFLAIADVVVHLAGENRPANPAAFEEVNFRFTQRLCQILQSAGKTIPVLFSSSVQSELNNPYGHSKRAAEKALEKLSLDNGNPVAIFRLPGVFGKWCRPNYNSVVATFCFNKANDYPVQINDAHVLLRLVYIDDVVNELLHALQKSWLGIKWPIVLPEYTITVGDLSDQIDAFKNCRSILISERVGTGFIRALYATYVSYFPVEKFVYNLPVHRDSRGSFVEMLKTPDSGQFSFFTAAPGVTRGGHYHHTKTEKFLVVRGCARFGFRHILTNEILYIETSGECPKVVETIPGWTHDITNIGDEEMVVMLWANEIFDIGNPDTITSKV
jgi:UDP-2-acetamido-2,6-beta-L-arabino-hexul-4-ose reductase